jgi:alkylation response protein AidB-like acyl-CoA dehydrogenase
MEFSFTKEQKMIRDAAREFLKKECPSDLVREMEEDDKGFPSRLWHKMAELGWQGLIFPVEYGGSDGSFLDLIILFEEMGRYLVPAPFLSTVILGGLSILSAGSEEQKQKFLPKIAKGDLILTMALTEPELDYNPAGINTQLSYEGRDFVITGTKVFVPYAHVADYFICATRTRNSERKEDGITLVLIEGNKPGVRCTVLENTACDKQCEIVFDRALVAEENVLGEYDEGWKTVRKVLQQATIAECALMLGGAKRVLEMTVDHAKKRIQFDKPIGSFQAIQHKCADMLIDLDGAKFATYEAAWMYSHGLHCALEVSIAKAWVNEAYKRICASGHQIHGGTGVIKDHDMHLYSRRAKVSEFLWGDTGFHREKVAQQLGL